LTGDSEEDFYDAFDSPQANVSVEDMERMQAYGDMGDPFLHYQSHDNMGWSQDDAGLLDEGAGEAVFAEDLTDLVRKSDTTFWPIRNDLGCMDKTHCNLISRVKHKG
jgi:hypothetical protein